MDQRENAADEKNPAENQDSSKSCAHVEGDAGNAKNGERDSEEQKPAPGGANLLDSGNEWIVDRF